MQFDVLAREESPLRAAISAAHRRDERECLPWLLDAAAMSAAQVASSRELAQKLVTAVRSRRTRSGGVDALMHEFSLSSQEGVALMCLAEALLRIPDRATADKLIRDKISRGDWRSHLGNSASLFVNAAAWGLLVTGKLVSSHSEEGLGGAVTRLIARGGEPLIRKGVDMAMRMLGKQFVTGETIEQALANGREREAAGYRFSFDMLGEAAMTEADAQRYMADYERAIHAIGKASAGRGVYGGPGISVKLSAIHPRYTRAQHERVTSEVLPRVKRLMLLAREYQIGVTMDAEECDRLDIALDVIEALALDPDLAGFDGIGIVVQAYQKRSPFVIDYLVDLARRSGHRLMVRLVKGAYWDAEVKRAQSEGLSGYPVYTRKVYTDVSYLACAKKLLAEPQAIYPQFATHNAYSMAAVRELAGEREYEFQCLHGMGETLYDQVVGDKGLGRACRVYAPVGSHETLLAYLVRRLLENGANSSFVNRIVDESVAIADLVADPLEEAARLRGEPHRRIALPEALYGDARRNSRGLDLNSEPELAALQAQLLAAEARRWSAAPLLGAGTAEGGATMSVSNPADRRDTVGWVTLASAADVESALAAASDARAVWAATGIDVRADCLERMAALMETHRGELMALAVLEAGKTLPNALGEVREAVDFCRYYAAQARAGLTAQTHAPLGVVTCISPWNFPLAIFCGQIAAALVAGNVVLAKPAEQTSLIAARAVELWYESGIGRAVLQLLPGEGEVVGAALVADPRVDGVVFTGSGEVARFIQRTLAARGGDIPLIAETGGQNAMIVDSSALPEQVVADVVSSAFDSAGQRCSALRVLFLQREIAEPVLAMLKGAMAELRVGNPARLSCDVGPVIDDAARVSLLAHIESLTPHARSCFRLTLDGEGEHGSYVAPTLFEIDDLALLPREVFGPVLHVLRYDAADLDGVIDAINATGYGLTHGVHSRVDETIERILARIRAGNVYVNRNIVGAVVGVQPFGGEGLSGTGPKAGGPLYLYRLTRGRWSLPTDSRPADAAVALEDSAATRVFWSAARLAALNAASPLSRRHELVGPTGEFNVLRFAPRGRVACVAGDDERMLELVAATLCCGNVAVLSPGALAGRLATALPGRVELATGELESMPIDALLFEGPLSQADDIRRRLAAREGALTPLVVAGPDGVELLRLVVERALSVNTTAAGGNASLMSMEE
ncbi:bifunctional proline dehydrogenase/L-glutamate gamma-semialdehyde dehydrogenase PutA [Paludibacterium yongneupense]|uniref:bifunctional proline dehydrogenase/L-glutamate gamma-semialdehyde dehydrogenase PutA n=1 Tax=Paludibacterium yongneupense TaxID=400061 RepID=UPI00040ECAEA|nr:bifunctional proline dehydrogenase/L-glutamate gamma-semialdehyde dehydrogenase PutA [Paludibacterium yongneupense]